LKPERGGSVVGRVALHHFYAVFRKETKRSFVFEREKICAQKREMSSQLRERK
jgi:hypothetical protein